MPTKINGVSIHANVTTDAIVEMIEEDEMGGFCIACGLEHHGIEPDAREYECESCGEATVYAAEELLLMTVA